MVSTEPPSERLHEAFLQQGQVKHALKTALACCLATGLAYWFRLPSGQLAPVFAFLLMTLGMPSPRLNWLLVQLAVGSAPPYRPSSSWQSVPRPSFSWP